MKKILMVVSAMMIISGMAGDASAISVEKIISLNIILAEGPVANLLYKNSYTYEHETPEDFEVPWDTVNSATLKIDGYYIDGNNDTVKIQNKWVGNLTPKERNSWFWKRDKSSVSSFNIESTFSSWSTGAPFKVTITADGDLGDGILELSTSTFTLDYDNQVAPVPEPSTLLLLGAGLLGLTGYRRRRFRTEG